MARFIVLTLCALLAFCNALSLNPRDLADEAAQQLQDLRSLVNGEIMAAHDEILIMGGDFLSYTIDVYDNGAIDLQQEYENVDSQVKSLVELAMSAGHDVTSCTNIREEVLERLPVQYSTQMSECIADINKERERVLEDAIFIVDLVTYRVTDLERRLTSCQGDLLCISPLLTEIALNMVRFPQNIKTEVQAIEALLDTMKLSVQSCSDTKVAEYTSQANSILRDITACIERIIS